MTVSLGAHLWGIQVTNAIAPARYFLSPSFNYVIVKIVPAMQLAAHKKFSTLYGWSYCLNSKFFRLDGLLLFRLIMGLRCACYELRCN